ncbi:MAG: hypothetical protein ABII02_02055 [Candidatus Magasanikbacteria bacterium]
MRQLIGTNRGAEEPSVGDSPSVLAIECVLLTGIIRSMIDGTPSYLQH